MPSASLCELCDVGIGVVSCTACSMRSLCELCDSELHRSAKTQQHQRKYMESGEDVPINITTTQSPAPSLSPSAASFLSPSSSSPFGSPSSSQPSRGSLAVKPRPSINLLTSPIIPHRASIAHPLGAVNSRSLIPLPPPTEDSELECDLCNDEEAEVHCDACNMNFCLKGECDEKMHQPQKMKDHIRTPIELHKRSAGSEEKSPSTPLSSESGQATDAPFVKMCDTCSEKMANWYCTTCQRFFCESCDHSIHKSSSMKTHSRAPYPPVFGRTNQNQNQNQNQYSTESEAANAGENRQALNLHVQVESASPTILSPQSHPRPSFSPLTSPLGGISPSLAALANQSRSLGLGTGGLGRNSRAMSVMAPAGNGRTPAFQLPIRPNLSSTPTAAAFSSKPATVATAPSANAAPICDICEDGRASVRCDECDMYLCVSNQCDEQLHAPMKMKHHVRNPINAISFTNSLPRPAAAATSPTVGTLTSSPTSPSIAAPTTVAHPPSASPMTPSFARPSTAPVNNGASLELGSPGPGGASLTSPTSAFSFDSPSSQPGRPTTSTLSPQPFRARASSVMIKTPPPAKSSIKQHNADGSILSLVPAIKPSASNQPSPEGTARTARGSRLCELCENCPAQVYCAACPMYLCTSGGCDKQLHAPAKMTHHIRTAIPKPTCSLCEENVAQLWCFDCKKHYCTTDDCDREYHKPAKSQHHRREHVDELHKNTKTEQKQETVQADLGAVPAFNIVVTPSPSPAHSQLKSEVEGPTLVDSPVTIAPVASPVASSTVSSNPSPVPHSPSLSATSNPTQSVVRPPALPPPPPPSMANVVVAHVIATAAKLPPVHPPALPASNNTPKAVSFFVLCDHCDKELATVVCETCQFTSNLTQQQRRFYCAKCESAVHNQEKSTHKRRPITKSDTLTEPPTASVAAASVSSLSSNNPLLSSKPLLTPIVSPAVSPAPSARSTLMSPNLPTSSRPTVATQRSLEVTVLPMCDRCSNAKADIYCEDCEFNLDHACFEQLHKSTSAKAHPRKMLVLQSSMQGSTPKSIPPVASVPPSPAREVELSSDVKPFSDSASTKFRSPIPKLDLSQPSLAIEGPLHPSALLPLSAFGTAHSSPASDSDIDLVSSPPTARETIAMEATNMQVQQTTPIDSSQLTSVASTVDSVPPPSVPVNSSTVSELIADRVHPVASDPILAPLTTLQTNLIQRVSSLEHQLQESVQLKSARIHSSRKEAIDSARRSGSNEHIPSNNHSNQSRDHNDLSSNSFPPPTGDVVVAAQMPSPLPPVSFRGVSDTPAAMAAIRAELKEARAQLQQFQQLANSLSQQLQQQQQAVANLSTNSAVAAASAIPPATPVTSASPQATESTLSSISIPFQQELTQLISNAIQTSLNASQESANAGTDSRRTKHRSRSKPKSSLATNNSFLVPNANIGMRTSLRKSLQPLRVSPSSDLSLAGNESSAESDAQSINNSSPDISRPSSRSISLQSSQRETSPRERKVSKKKKKIGPVVPRLPLPSSSFLPLPLTQSTKASQRKQSQSPNETLAAPTTDSNFPSPSPPAPTVSSRPLNDSVVFLTPTQRSFAPASAAATRRSPIHIPAELDSHRMSDEEEEEKQSVHLLTSTEEEEHNETQRAIVVSRATEALIARYREEAAASIVQNQTKQQLSHHPSLTPLQASASSSPSLTPSMHRALVVDPLSLSVTSASASKRRARELRRQAEIEEQLKFETQRRQADQEKIAKLQQQIQNIQTQLQEKAAALPANNHSLTRQQRHHASTPSLLSYALSPESDHASSMHRPRHVVRASVSATLAQTTPRTMFKLMEAQIYADHVKQAEEKGHASELHAAETRQSIPINATGFTVKHSIPSLLSESSASQQMQHAMSAFDRLSPEQQRKYFADNIVFSSSYLHPQLPWELQLARPSDEGNDHMLPPPTAGHRRFPSENGRMRPSRSSFDEEILTQIYSPEMVSKSIRHGSAHASPLKPVAHHERANSSGHSMKRAQSAGTLHPQNLQKLPSSNSWMS